MHISICIILIKCYYIYLNFILNCKKLPKERIETQVFRPENSLHLVAAKIKSPVEKLSEKYGKKVLSRLKTEKKMEFSSRHTIINSKMLLENCMIQLD